MQQVRLPASISLNCALLLASACTVLLTAPLAAQSIAPGTRVRITARDSAGKPYEGKFLRASQDSIWFVNQKSNATQSFFLRDAEVEQSTYYKRRFWRAVVGAGIGVTVAFAASAIGLDAATCKGCQADPGAGLVIVGAMLLGAPIGAAIGASTGGEQWRVVKKPLAVGATSGSRRQIPFASFTF